MRRENFGAEAANYEPQVGNALTERVAPANVAEGAEEGHGVSSVVNGAPGPEIISLDGSLILPK